MRGQLEDTVVNSYQISMTPANEVPAVVRLDAECSGEGQRLFERNAAGERRLRHRDLRRDAQLPCEHHIHAASTSTRRAAGANGGVVINTGLGSRRGVGG